MPLSALMPAPVETTSLGFLSVFMVALFLGEAAKASYDVKVGDKIEISMGGRTVAVEVLQVAENVRKDDATAMYKEI